MTGKLISNCKNSWAESSINEKLLAIVTSVTLLCFLVFFSLAVSGKIGFLIVKSASMQLHMPPGSLVVFSAAGIESIAPGEIVVFKDGATSSTLVTHRAIEKTVENGKTLIKTKGDSNNRSDSSLVDSSMLMGRGLCIVPWAGWLMAFTKTPVGMLILNLMLVLLIVLIISDRLSASIKRSYERYLPDLDDQELVHPTAHIPGKSDLSSLKN